MAFYVSVVIRAYKIIDFFDLQTKVCMETPELTIFERMTSLEEVVARDFGCLTSNINYCIFPIRKLFDDNVEIQILIHRLTFEWRLQIRLLCQRQKKKW